MLSDIQDFNAVEAWLSGFKVCHGLMFKNFSGKKADVDEAMCEEWLSGPLKKHLENYLLGDEFSANETALFQIVTKQDSHVKRGRLHQREEEQRELLFIRSSIGTRYDVAVLFQQRQYGLCSQNFAEAVDHVDQIVFQGTLADTCNELLHIVQICSWSEGQQEPCSKGNNGFQPRGLLM